MKKLLGIAALTATAIITLNGCSAKTSDTSTTTALTDAGKMSSGLGSSVSTIQQLGNAMGTNGAFGARSVSSLAATTKCTAHADPGTDANLDGTVSDSERISQSANGYALQKFYCTLAMDTSSPEAVSGAVRTFKTVICAIEKQLGGLTFDGTPVAFTSITFDSTCATAEQIASMGSTVSIPGGATVTASLNPTFSEIPGNTHYTHGIKIVSNDGTSLKYIVVAKFSAAVTGDPTDSGDFEFATLGTGTVMQGTAIEYTAGKIYGTGTTKHLWYESRTNRIKATASDALCKPLDSAASSCGFARHVRISTDLGFTGGDLNVVENMYGIISDAGDVTGSAQSNHMTVITATGALSSGLTGKIWSSSSAPSTLTTQTVSTGLTPGATTCIPSGGGSVTTTGCGTPLTPTGVIKTFLLPGNSNTWLANSSTKGGIGFTGASTVADEQFVSP